MAVPKNFSVLSQYRAAPYERLSREDGDRLESDSILNQQNLIEDYCARHPGFVLVEHYADDGYTGTTFKRPAFQRMLADIEAGKIDCVIVKDLSRFGRDYIDMGYYLERYFPSHRVRFIAINDNVDSERGPYDLMLPLKNVFNTQYAKDISGKVRSSFEVKQNRGQFVGAFASYGYLKDPEQKGHLIPDPVASQVVRRVFDMAAHGIGQIRIAKILNEEGVPCPSEYKRLMGDKYRNSKKLDATKYWTYPTVHKMLANEMYLGSMVQRRSVRPTMHGKAVAAPRKDWAIVENTHEAIISKELWDTVQAQLNKNTRALDLNNNVGLFAGLVKCGDCGRSMVKAKWDDRIHYSCGSYRRYGASFCSKHYIPQSDLEEIILADLNSIIAAVDDLAQVAAQNRPRDDFKQRMEEERRRLETAIARIQRLKQNAYEDYRDSLLSRDEFMRYKADYDRQERTLSDQLEALNSKKPDSLLEEPWVEQLLRLGHLTELDRATLAQTVKEILIFENKQIEITYLFSDSLRVLLEGSCEEDSQDKSNALEGEAFKTTILRSPCPTSQDTSITMKHISPA